MILQTKRNRPTKLNCAISGDALNPYLFTDLLNLLARLSLCRFVYPSCIIPSLAFDATNVTPRFGNHMSMQYHKLRWFRVSDVFHRHWFQCDHGISQTTTMGGVKSIQLDKASARIIPLGS
jgi:hypothetical protein